MIVTICDWCNKYIESDAVPVTISYINNGEKTKEFHFHKLCLHKWLLELPNVKRYK